MCCRKNTRVSKKHPSLLDILGERGYTFKKLGKTKLINGVLYDLQQTEAN